MQMKKKANLALMTSLAISFVVMIIVVAIGGTVLEKFQSVQTENGTAWNSTGQGLSGIKTFGDYSPTIAIVVVSAVVIGLILVYFRTQ